MGDRNARASGGSLTVTAAAFLTLVCISGVLAGAATSAHLGGIINFSAAPAAPRSARTSFTHNLMGRPPKGLEVGKLRRIGAETFPGEAQKLFVAPVASGGFCYEWAFELGGTTSWLAEASGCSPAHVSQPLLLTSYDGTRVSIIVHRALVDSVSVKLSDGSVVAPSLLWVSAPINAGFWLYQPPSGLHVVELDALQHGKVVDREPINQP